MRYIDSDGVLADFTKWVKIHIKESPEPTLGSVYGVDWVMVHYYKEAFLDMDRCKNSKPYFKMLKSKNTYVLTAVPKLASLKKRFPEIEDIEDRWETLIENKYKWFEKYGVPRSKVIITDGSSKKISYCTGPWDVLYDDRELNVKRWNEAGGRAYFVEN